MANQIVQLGRRVLSANRVFGSPCNSSHNRFSQYRHISRFFKSFFDKPEEQQTTNNAHDIATEKVISKVRDIRDGRIDLEEQPMIDKEIDIAAEILRCKLRDFINNPNNQELKRLDDEIAKVRRKQRDLEECIADHPIFSDVCMRNRDDLANQNTKTNNKIHKVKLSLPWFG